MGKILKSITLPNGNTAQEKGCGDYQCRYCGGKATATNFVAGLCLQVYAKHQGMCGAYVNNEKYSGYITECSTCRYADGDGLCGFSPASA